MFSGLRFGMSFRPVYWMEIIAVNEYLSLCRVARDAYCQSYSEMKVLAGNLPKAISLPKTKNENVEEAYQLNFLSGRAFQIYKWVTIY
jgi:hypothetical protein